MWLQIYLNEWNDFAIFDKSLLSLLCNIFIFEKPVKNAFKKWIGLQTEPNVWLNKKSHPPLSLLLTKWAPKIDESPKYIGDIYSKYS